ncbi:hypothetical protein D4764_04G0004830 [Takifugu flavidus]|uniref:Uncharacterized protein n=1 Tax=Takifugu flavidus TaxID=433684 RepID=A0A5C6N3L2_9TELE|nr:hypothetical protein D4764_04G0004830 [Takifugu flavidus]
MDQLLTSGNHPEWLTQGRKVLIMKDPQKGTIPSNYRPITCLSTTWKLLSGIIAAKITVYPLPHHQGLCAPHRAGSTLSVSETGDFRRGERWHTGRTERLSLSFRSRRGWYASLIAGAAGRRMDGITSCGNLSSQRRVFPPPDDKALVKTCGHL